MNDETEQQDETMDCGLSVVQRDELQRRLGELADTMPPRVVWNRIEEQARAEGLIGARPYVQKTKWFLGAGLAAAVALLVLRLPWLPPELSETEDFSTEPPLTQTAGGSNSLNVLNALMVESRQLENNLRSLPEQPLVVRAGTAATIVRLEDTIARIDSDLNDPTLDLSASDRELYWRERVRLMTSLVQLRAAQARRKSF